MRLPIIITFFCVLLLNAGGGGRCHAAPAQPEPRYIFLNIALNPRADRLNPAMLSRGQFEEVVEKIGAPDNPQLRVGISYVFSTMESSVEELEGRLREVFSAAEATDVPIMVALDGQNWWQGRPDLWNWWDPNQPGYNPDNVHNVEWTGWFPETAVKIGWRNWGRQLRVAPAPNLSSPRVVAEHLSRLRPLAAVVAEWHKQLPPDRKWLFGGLKVGWETGIGYNAYYYPEGNRILEQWPTDTSNDPQHSLDLARGLDGGAAQLGYAAVKTAGIRARGELSREDIALVVQRYLAALARTAHDAGVPRDLIYTHQGGTYLPWEKHLPFWPAFNRWSNPGWSFYGMTPDQIEPLGSVFKQARRSRWGAAEWWVGGADASAWEEHLRRTLAYQDCRFISIYNWNQGMFENETAGHEAVRRLVAGWREDEESPAR